MNASECLCILARYMYLLIKKIHKIMQVDKIFGALNIVQLYEWEGNGSWCNEIKVESSISQMEGKGSRNR